MSRSRGRRRPVLRPGDVVAIRFDDHSEGEEVADITVYGRVLRANNRTVVLLTWHPTDLAELGRFDNDSASYAIARGSIAEIRILERP